MKFDNLEKRVIAAKRDKKELNELIREYRPFIRKKATEVIPHEKYDSFSTVAMEAFAEAIKAFEEGRGSFLGFASMVIKRRVKDLVRKEYKPDEMPSENIEIQAEADDRSGLSIEVEIFTRELLEYGICIMELPGASPKHRSSKEKADRAAKVLAETEHLMEQLVSTKKMPVTRLSELAGVPFKLIEKKRKYIVARALISRNKYGYLGEYID